MDEQADEHARDDAGPHPEPRVMRLLHEHGRAAWMLVGLLLAAGLLGFVFARIQLILLAIFVALVVAAVVAPAARWLEARGANRTLATATGLLLVVTLLGGSIGLVGYRMVAQLPAVVEDVRSQRGELLGLLERPPISLSEEEVQSLLGQSVEEVAEGQAESEGDGNGDNGSEGEGDGEGDGDGEETTDGEGLDPSTALALLRGSAAAIRVLGVIAVGVVLSFFIVRDRDAIARGAIRHLAGGEHDQRARDVLHAAWQALNGYVRASVTVGAIEGSAIGLVLVLFGTPLAGSIAILTFLAAFVPVVGATVAGALAVLLTWVGVGLAEAVAVGVIVVVIQQVDANILQPRIVAVHTTLHPIATILALLVGGLVGGLFGALLAVPTAAVLVAVSSELLAPEPIDEVPAP